MGLRASDLTWSAWLTQDEFNELDWLLARGYPSGVMAETYEGLKRLARLRHEFSWQPGTPMPDRVRRHVETGLAGDLWRVIRDALRMMSDVVNLYDDAVSRFGGWVKWLTDDELRNLVRLSDQEPQERWVETYRAQARVRETESIHRRHQRAEAENRAAEERRARYRQLQQVYWKEEKPPVIPPTVTEARAGAPKVPGELPRTPTEPYIPEMIRKFREQVEKHYPKNDTKAPDVMLEHYRWEARIRERERRLMGRTHGIPFISAVAVPPVPIRGEK